MLVSSKLPKKTLGALTAAALALTVVSTSADALDSPAEDNAGKKVDGNHAIAEVANEYFEQNASIMVFGLERQRARHHGQSATRSHVLYRDVDFMKKVEDFRVKLASLGETYSASRSESVVEKVMPEKNGTVKAIVEEATYLKVADDDVETAYAVEHEMTFAKTEDGKLRLTRDVHLGPTGLMPLWQAEKLVKPDSDYFKKSATEEIAFGEMPEEKAAAADVEANKPDITMHVTSKRKRKVAPEGKSGRYDYDAMGRYLDKYWKNYNKKYRSFEGKGGDCTNFVSQALRHGGWKDTGKGKRSKKSWYYKEKEQSFSWAGAKNWYKFAKQSGRTTFLDDVRDLRKGDVLQYKSANGRRIGHTMMVSWYSFKKHRPYLTYHSESTHNRSLNQILLDTKGATYWAYRT